MKYMFLILAVFLTSSGCDPSQQATASSTSGLRVVSEAGNCRVYTGSHDGYRVFVVEGKRHGFNCSISIK